MRLAVGSNNDILGIFFQSNRAVPVAAAGWSKARQGKSIALQPSCDHTQLDSGRNHHWSITTRTRRLAMSQR